MWTRLVRGGSWSAVRTATAAAWIIGVVASTTPTTADTRWGADYFPNVTLTTQDGASVRFYDDLLKGKTVAIDLIYTTCQYACPLETARLVQVQRLLGGRVGRDIFFYSITIDPEHDTPAVLRDYADKYHVAAGWTFLTGNAADIDLISKKLGLYSAPNPDNPDGHTPSLLVGNEPSGQWMRNSALDNPAFLARTMSDWLDSWKDNAAKPLPSFAEAPAIDLDAGAYSFSTHCAACHTIGGGDRIGPDLHGVTASRDRAWLKRFIVAPDKVLAEGDPIATRLFEQYGRRRMPNLSLTDADADAVVGYLARAGNATKPVAASPPSDRPLPLSAAELSQLIEPYLRIQRALAGDSVDGIALNALALANATVKIGSRTAAVRAAVNPFAQASDLPRAREAFGPLSEAMIAVVGGAIPEGLAVAYCPMARKTWLQEGAPIHNPYYGLAMADCGRVVRGVGATPR